jgi:hypothetical protein
VVACWAHNPEVRGSNPLPATKTFKSNKMTNEEVIILSKTKVNKKGKPFGGKRIPEPIPKTKFTVTAVGLAKCESGKYKSRWCAKKKS